MYSADGRNICTVLSLDSRSCAIRVSYSVNASRGRRRYLIGNIRNRLSYTDRCGQNQYGNVKNSLSSRSCSSLAKFLLKK